MKKIQHFDKTLLAFDEKVDRFGKNFELYEKAILESQEKVFEGFKASLFEGMHKFKEVYEEEKSIDAKIKMMDKLKQEIKNLNEETNEVMAKIGKIPNPAQEEQDNIENEILSSEKITENTEQTKENQNDSDTLDSNKNFNKEEKEDK